MVIQGERNLTPQMAERFSKACCLHGEAAEYFRQLVQFNQAKIIEDRNRYYQRLTSFSRYRRAQKLEMAHAAYHSKWYLPAIRELAARSDFIDDPERIAGKLVPSITAREAEQAIAILFKMGLLQRDEEGRVFQGTPVLTTGPETVGMHIVNYHRSMMSQAAQSIDGIAPHERDISSLTMCLEHRTA